MNAFRVLLPSFRGRWITLAIAVAAAACAQAIGIPFALLARGLVNDVAIHESATESMEQADALWMFGSLMAGLAIARAIASWQQATRGERLAQEVLADVRKRMYSRLQQLSQGYFDRRPAGKTVLRFIGDATALRTWIARTLVTVPADVLTLLGIAIALVAVDSRLLVALTIPLVALIPILLLANPRARRLTRDVRREQARLGDTIATSTRSMAVIQAQNLQDEDAAAANELIDRIARSNVSRSKWDAAVRAATLTASTAALGAVALFGTSLLLRDEVQQGDLLAAVWLTLIARGPIARLSRANVLHQRARVACDRITALLNRRPQPGWDRALEPYAGPCNAITFDNCGYRDIDGNWAFRGLTAHFGSPTLLAIRSDSPRAASILLQLLVRVRRPHEGRIRLDGQDVRSLRVANVRRQLGWLDADRRANTLSHGADEPPVSSFEFAWTADTPLAPREVSTREDELRQALALALRHTPGALLLDSPSAGLPTEARSRLLAWLRRVAHRRLVIVATNDPAIHSIAHQTLSLEPDEPQPNGFESSSRRSTIE